MNRSLLDSTLDYQQSQFQEDTREENYKQYFEGNQFNSDSYDFTDRNQLLQRQKNLIESYQKNQKQKQNQIEEDSNLLKNLSSLQKICVILCFGGHFSIGIFKKNQCLFHKSDHKYVSRKKAGKRQLAKDKTSNIKSMGSQIRRANEQKHQQKVSDILSENLEQIKDCDVVFLQAPGINKLILIEQNQPLYSIRHKLRSVCFSSKKANYTEVERVYQSICKVYFFVKKL